MTKNALIKFIDSCVGNIARKIEDEFNESDHPRDKGGKFTSKGGEGRGGGSYTSTSTGRNDILSELYTNGQGGVSKKEIRSVLNMLTDNEVDPEDTTTIKNVWEGAGIDPDKKDIKLTQQYLKNYHSKGGGGSTKASKGSSKSNEELIQVKRAAKAARRFKSSGIDLASAMEDLDIPTEGVPEAYLESVFEGSLSEDPKLLRKAEDYIERYESGELEKEADSSGTEEDGEGADGDDADVSLEQYKKNVSENFDGDEEYEVEARYDRAKYHSDKFKKLQNGEYDGTPEEKRLKNYYRRLGIKKPEDAFKVWWDI